MAKDTNEPEGGTGRGKSNYIGSKALTRVIIFIAVVVVLLVAANFA